MGCINDRQLRQLKSKRKQFRTKFPNSNNPIVKIAKQYEIQQLKNKWLNNQIQVLSIKLNIDAKKNLDYRISRTKFLQLLPQLSNLSEVIFSPQKFYRKLETICMICSILKNKFNQIRMIIMKSDEYDVLADLFFYVYSSSTTKSIMNRQDLQLFQKQFKQYQLDYRSSIHHSVQRVSLKDSQGNVSIPPKPFRQIFQQYDIFSIRNLFKFDIKSQKATFLKLLKNQGIDRHQHDRVYLIQFSWFMKWKLATEYETGQEIVIKQNSLPINRNCKLKIQAFVKTHPSIVQEAKKLASNKQATLEPMNNSKIIGEEEDDLRQNCQEFVDFISVGQGIHRNLRFLYGGKSLIVKPYPYYYALSSSQMRFKPNFAKNIFYKPDSTFQQIYEKRRQQYSYKYSLQQILVYYKCVGKTQWIKIDDLNTTVSQHPFLFKTYILFCPKQRAQKFQQKFNIVMIDKKRRINQRVKNYGSMINFQNEGVLQQGYVGYVGTHSVKVFVTNKEGKIETIQKSSKGLQKVNPSILEQQFFQGLAGLQNIGNTCYINSTIQCLLRTPYFGDYLESKPINQKKQPLSYQLNRLYQNTKQSRQCISMTKFKACFDKLFPFFQGSHQHDSQQFLILLLDKLTQQQTYQSSIRISQSRISSQRSNTQATINTKSFNLFSGITKAQTSCIKCHNKGVTQQSFYTYSLSLPIIKQQIFTFYYIDQAFKVFKYCLSAQKDIETHEMIEKISGILKIQGKKLLIMTIFQKEWMNNFKRINQKNRISNFQNYDTQIICYKVKYEENPDYEDFIDKVQRKSVKLEVRNRIYDERQKLFKSFFYPFYAEIDSTTTGLQLKQQITQKLENFIDQKVWKQLQNAPQKNDMLNSRGLSTNSNSNFLETQPLNSTPSFRQTITLKKEQVPFQIRLLKNEDSRFSQCWMCRKNTPTNNDQLLSSEFCQGCFFKDEQVLYQNKKFIRNSRSLSIAIDWKNEMIIKDFQVIQTQSCKQSQKLQLSRRSKIQNLLKQNFTQQQKIQLRCQNQTCQSNQALRKQKIKSPPNILILHLKRFQYRDNDFYKLKNHIDIPQSLTLPGFYDQYTLYGNIIHNGSGNGRSGHYINYVKTNQKWFNCDDQKVYQIKKNKEFLDPNTYLLFYKKKNIQKTFQLFRA